MGAQETSASTMDATAPISVRCSDWLDAIVCGDCMEVLPGMPDKSVDVVITDPPYAVTDNEWDAPFNLAAWWVQVRRICRGAIVMTATQPFATDVINANRKGFRYDWVWDKVNKHSNYLNANNRPLRRHESVLVFADGEHTYNPQMEKREPYTRRLTTNRESVNYGTPRVPDSGQVIEEGWPSTVLQMKGHMTTGIMHPTQKPAELARYLVLTYSNPGDVILDPFCGSGTTCLAARQTGRHWLGIEKDQHYAETTKTRIIQEMCLGV